MTFPSCKNLSKKRKNVLYPKSWVAQNFEINDCYYTGWEKLSIGSKTAVIHGLVHSKVTPKKCSRCSSRMYKHDKRELRLIDIPSRGIPDGVPKDIPAGLQVFIPRAKCSKCNKVWQPTLAKHPEITDRAFKTIGREALIGQALSNKSYRQIAESYLLDQTKVKEILLAYIEEYADELHFKTPTHIGIAQINIKTMGKMTVIVNLDYQTVFDLLLDVNSKTLEEYFATLPEREDILWVFSDLRTLPKTITTSLPNARWSLADYHVEKKLTEAFDISLGRIINSMSSQEQVRAKELIGLLKIEASKLSADQRQRIEESRSKNLFPTLFQAYDLRNQFINDYNNYGDENSGLIAFNSWVKSIPNRNSTIFSSFTEFGSMLRQLFDRNFCYWSAPWKMNDIYGKCIEELPVTCNLQKKHDFSLLRIRLLYSEIGGINGGKLSPAVRIKNKHWFGHNYLQ